VTIAPSVTRSSFRPLLTLGFFVVISVALSAQAPEPPVADTRLTVHTLLREDAFAGYLQNDLARLARAEKNVDLLLASRPGDRPSLLAWQGGIALTRAVVANEAKQPRRIASAKRSSARRWYCWNWCCTRDGELWKMRGGICRERSRHA
jgi:hypothetical protein